jgi:DnaJ-class molecular chaperone
MTERTDYYQLLGLDENAPAEAIKQAYRSSVRACHPDRRPDDPAAAEQFKVVTEAYEVLSDPARRQQYDLLRRPPFDAFGQFPIASAFSDPPKPPVTLRLRLSFEQALRGGKATVQLPAGRTAHIPVPKGIRDGATARLKGKPKAGAAPLHVTFRVAPSDRFRRNGDDLHVIETISVFDALFGATRTVTDAYGRDVSLDIPAGTQPGDRIRIAGHGVATVQRTGDLVIEIAVSVPRDLSDEQRARLRAAAEDAGLL